MSMKIEMTWPPMTDACRDDESKAIEAWFFLPFRELARTYPYFPTSLIKERFSDMISDLFDHLGETKLEFTDIDEIVIKPRKVMDNAIPDQPCFAFLAIIKLRTE